MFELVDVGIFDDTGQACFTLTDAACSSASHWQPSHTVLLISKPLEWSLDKIPKLRMSSNTRVDVDPEMGDALWLRSLAQRLTKRDHVNPPFPEGGVSLQRFHDDGTDTCLVFDIQAAETAPLRMLFTLADIDELYACRYLCEPDITNDPPEHEQTPEVVHSIFENHTFAVHPANPRHRMLHRLHQRSDYIPQPRQQLQRQDAHVH
jgi:hypothetical protein